jgi:hypothetical protein
VKLYQITLHTERGGADNVAAALRELADMIEERDRERVFRDTPGIDNRFWGKRMTATIRSYWNYHNGRSDHEGLDKD